MVFGDSAVLGALEDLRDFVIGIDPMRIEEFWSTRFYRTIFHGPSFYSAVAGVEHALWDIAGKSLGVPVYQLTGGAVRDKIRLYANTWFVGARTADEYAERASVVTAAGWDAIKFDPLPGSLLAASRQELRSAVEQGQSSPGGGRARRRHPHRMPWTAEPRERDQVRGRHRRVSPVLDRGTGAGSRPPRDAQGP